MLDVIIVRHSICQADCAAWEEGLPAFHDEQLLGYYHLQECIQYELSMLQKQSLGMHG